MHTSAADAPCITVSGFYYTSALLAQEDVETC